MAIGSTSDTTGVRAAREQARLRQSLLNSEYRKAKRSGNYMGALKATMLGEELGVKVGGTVRSEDVAAAGEQQYQSEMQKVRKTDAPTGLDAYKAMQPQARAARAQAATQTQGAAQEETQKTAQQVADEAAKKPDLEKQKTENLTAQFREIYSNTAPEKRLSVVRAAQRAGVPLSAAGQKMIAKADEESTPKIRPPMTRMGPGGKTEFTEEGKKYYESLETSPRVANMVAESEGARLGRKLGEQYRRIVGAVGTAAKTQKEVSDIEREFQFRGAVPEYEGKMQRVKPLEEEQARIKESQSKVIRSQIASEQGGNPLLAGLPKPVTEFAQQKPDWAASPKPRPVPYTVPKRQPRIKPDEAEYELGRAEYDRKQEEQKKRLAAINTQIAQARSLRPPTR